MHYVASRLFLFQWAITLSLNEVSGLEAEGIVGGDPVSIDEYGYMVSIETESDNICGGGIIGDRYVLTAAHCVLNRQPEFRNAKLTVLAGSNKARSTKDPHAIRVPVAKIYVPKEYEPMNFRQGDRHRPVGDIAVLELKESLGLDSNPSISKLRIAEGIASYDGEKATVTGYGVNSINVFVDPITNDTYEYGAKSTDELRRAEALVIETSACQRAVVDPVTPSHICAAIIQRDPDSPEGVCSGDSGSPLVYDDDIVIGILSSSPRGCREDDVPAVYTRVSSFAAFIQEVIGQTS